MSTPTLLLLVEDSEDDAFFFKRTFKQAGVAFSISHVINGEAAIQYLKKAAAENSLPQIIFLDLKLPILNGFEVLSWMKTQTFSAPIPVIVLSGSVQQSDQVRAFELGAAEYLAKPVLIKDLRRLLGEVLAKTRQPVDAASSS